ncbi:MAG: fasciclin domain-containing protein [Desulfobacteraceae bacterium]|jgi:uncharacterized surface protein with fasciclin (FAS1) repeats
MVKTSYKYTTLMILILLGGLVMGCSSSDDSSNSSAASEPASTDDIVDTAVAAGSFNTLVAALQAAGLEEVLRGPGPFTVFAPTDTAFSAIPQNVLDGLLNDPNQAALRDILKYHVFDGDVRANDALALAGQSVAMVNGDLMAIDTVGSDLVLNNGGTASATVTSTDILASNGVIHVIDAVLAPADGKSNIVDTLANLGDFTTLITAVQAAGLENTLSGPGPFTLFAPTDTAFGKIPANVINDLLNDVPALQNVLTYHAIGAEVFAVDAIAAAGGSVTMLNGDDVAIDLVGSDVVLNSNGNSPSTVTVTDVISTNGIIHVIDTVLDTNDAP